MAAHPHVEAVRILVVGEADESRAASASEFERVLGRIGDGVEIESRSPHEDLAKDFVPDRLDLLVIDGGFGPQAAVLRQLDRLAGFGPPLLVVLPRADDELALRCFRAGADQCVCVGPDFADVLCEAALELIGDWRAERERGRVEKHVEWLEGLNDAIVNRLPAALVVVAADDAVVSVNPEASRLFSLSPSQAQGRALSQVCPEALYRDAALGDLVASARRGDPPQARRARLYDGERLSRAYDVQAQKLDVEGRVLLVLNEVTASERQAERIDELQRYNANLIQNMNSALVVVGPDARIQFANPMAERLLGRSPGELVGLAIADCFAPEDTGLSLLTRALETGERVQGAECALVARDGCAVPVGVSCSPLRDAPGRTRGAVAVFQDLSEIKQLERQVVQNEKMASIGQLAAGVAHEINNPVGFIHANLFQLGEYLQDLEGVFDGVEALQQVIAGGGDAAAVAEASQSLQGVAEKIALDYLRGDLRKAVEESQEGTERIRHIVRDLRGFSRADNDRSALADINECIDSTANIVWTMSRHAVTLVRDYGEVPRLRCRPMQIKQVVMNLLLNACQAIVERGADCDVPGEVRVRTRARDGGVWIEIRDNGVGIPPEVQARIFDPFFTTKDVGSGTGLGLSTSYGIVERHRGEIRAASEPGIGTSFEVFLPNQTNTDEAVVGGAPQPTPDEGAR
ncbi:MAG: PAS domain-containing protein [Myxococcota bacterium]|jgi:PAS domain S-box-containing protein|nr:PAS domain-containing protein [Myxococcota bacterium]